MTVKQESGRRRYVVPPKHTLCSSFSSLLFLSFFFFSFFLKMRLLDYSRIYVLTCFISQLFIQNSLSTVVVLFFLLNRLNVTLCA